MKRLFNKIKNAGISIYEYKENNKLCGYELNTYTKGGVNQIVFIDFRDTDKKPNNPNDFKDLFFEIIKSIDIDEEVEINRQNKTYRNDFTISESLQDFTDWKNQLLTLANSLNNSKPKKLTGLERYPEFKKLVNEIVEEVAKKINEKAPKIKSEMPYKCQFVLEEIIQNLQDRV